MPSVRRLMTADPVWISSATHLDQAVRVMREHSLSSLPVCDESGRIVGVLSDRSVLMAWAHDGGDPRTITVGETADPVVVTVAPEDEAGWALELMGAFRQHRLYVVDHDRLIGVIAHSDLARAMPVDDMGRLLLDLATS